MSPGGHLVTTLAACGAAGALTQSWPVVAGVAAGGLFIDVDHAIDYVLFEGQRDLRPGAFLRYYVEGRVKRVVLALHSYELFGLLAVVAWWSEWTPLWAYLAGAVLHLGLDIAFNGEFVPGNIVAFYSFVYRARHRFRGPALLSKNRREAAPDGFWRAFFRGAAPTTGEPGTVGTSAPVQLARGRNADRWGGAWRGAAAGEPSVNGEWASGSEERRDAPPHVER